MAAFTKSQKCARQGSRVPVGHLMAAEIWRGTPLLKSIGNQVPVIFETSISPVDFYPAVGLAVVSFTEADVVAYEDCERRLRRLKSLNLHGVVIAERSRLTVQYFDRIQLLCSLHLGLAVVPVSSALDAARLLVCMVRKASRRGRNPMEGEVSENVHWDVSLVQGLQNVPGLGPVKAKALLQKYGSYEAMCKAPRQDLSLVVGGKLVEKLWELLHGSAAKRT